MYPNWYPKLLFGCVEYATEANMYGLLILYMLPLLNSWQGNNNLSLIDIKEAMAKIKTFSTTNCYNFLSFTQLYQEPLLMQEPLLNVSHQQHALQTKVISF